MFGLDLTTLIVGELALGLFVLCVVLLWHARRQGRLLAAMGAEMRTLAETPPPPPPEMPPVPGYEELLDEQIGATRNHHLALGAEHDIVLDLAPEAPLERQALALRHALLIAEKEAWAAGSAGRADWSLLTDKLGRIIEFLREEAGPRAEEATRTDAESTPAPALLTLLTDYHRHSRDLLGALGTLEQELKELRGRLGEEDLEAVTIDVAAASALHDQLEARYVALAEQAAV